MNPRFHVLCLITASSLAGLGAPPPIADVPADPRMKLAQELSDRLGEQVERTKEAETLKQTWEYPNYLPPNSHTQLVRLGKGIEVVTESHAEENVFTQKDYFLHESKVYVHRISRHDPCVDGKTKRISESYILFDKGTPFYRSGFTARVPLADKAPDLSKMKTRTKEQEAPLPPGLDGWGNKLTAHAFDIARTLRPGVGRYAFGDWDEWLLKDAPPEGAGDPPLRTETWLPPADTLALPVRESASPDGLYSIGWGYEKGPVNWKQLATVEQSAGWGAVTFSTKMVDIPQDDPLRNDGNFLLNQVTGKSLCKLGICYPGERQRFNHDELLACWSPTSACVVTIVTAKWFTEYGHIAWIKDGRSEGSYDIMEPLSAAAIAATKKSKHAAAKRLLADDDYSYTLSKILVEDDGSFEALVVGEIPKDDAPGGFFEVAIEGTFSPGEKDGPAGLKVSKVKVLPAAPRD